MKKRSKVDRGVNVPLKIDSRTKVILSLAGQIPSGGWVARCNGKKNGGGGRKKK